MAYTECGGFTAANSAPDLLGEAVFGKSVKKRGGAPGQFQRPPKRREPSPEKASLGCAVEWNVLINPLHPAMTGLKIEPPLPFHFDARMFR